jgi:hypothetical protein
MRLSAPKHRAALTSAFLILAISLAQGKDLPNNPCSFEVPSGSFFHILVVFQDKFPAIINRTANEAAMSFWQVDRPPDPPILCGAVTEAGGGSESGKDMMQTAARKNGWSS